MLRVLSQGQPLCTGLSRREVLRIGGLSALGLTLPRLLEARADGAASPVRARRCILFFQEGGMAHQDTLDPKPGAPDGVGGEFGSIPTRVPGIHFSEHLPLLAGMNDRFAVVRSVSHDVFDHNAGAYYCLAGHHPQQGSQLVQGDRRTNFPGIGAIVARLRPAPPALPDFVHCPNILTNNGEDLPGQKAGWLGGAYDPLVLPDPTSPAFGQTPLAAGTGAGDRDARRRSLLHQVQGALDYLGATGPGQSVDRYYERAFSLVTSPAARRACDLSLEPQRARERYGTHHLGQTFLLARRLSEAGVPLVQICWGANSGSDSNQNWDTHRRNFHFLKNSLLPPFDRGLATLLQDLEERGLLRETLVVVMGEFGRTPEINRQAGRDHWPHCYSILLAGGGVRGGAVCGASDARAAWPARDAVGPEDVAATIFHALGIDPKTVLVDPLGRPWPVALGEPLHELFG